MAAATVTVSQDPSTLNSHEHDQPLTPSRGVVTLSGYGISVRVNRGHLIVEDGIGPIRRRARFARVNHGLSRLIVIGTDGAVSLAALRWLADQKASFAMIERDGSVLLSTGPAGPRLSRLRRAQALALHGDTGMTIARDLVDRKLAEQRRLINDALQRADVAQLIDEQRARVPFANDINALRLVESQAAHAYWSCWRELPVLFPKADLRRVPEHWRTFGARISPLTGSPRLSASPPNAMLNYLYAILESEARIAATAVGLDPELGVMHLDANARDSLACDLMEPVRPLVDAYVLTWITRQPLRREWFFEERNGNCRLMASFAEKLGHTASTWAQALAPIAEHVARTLWATRGNRVGGSVLATRLTQQRRRAAKGAARMIVDQPAAPPRLCRDCGATIRHGLTRCGDCCRRDAPERMRAVAATFAHTPEALTRRAATQTKQRAAERAWTPANHPAWLTARAYRDRIKPLLSRFSAPKLALAMGVSTDYAAAVRHGHRRPHPRHWTTLARLVGVERGLT